MEEETRKLLGRLNGDHVEPAGFSMTAHCNRVAVEDGHTESVSVKLRQKAAPDEIIAAFNEFPLDPAATAAAAGAGATDRLRRCARPSAAPLRRGPRQRHDGERWTAASLRRAGLQVHRALAQHHSRRGGRGAAQRRTAESARLPAVTARPARLAVRRDRDEVRWHLGRGRHRHRSRRRHREARLRRAAVRRGQRNGKGHRPVARHGRCRRTRRARAGARYLPHSSRAPLH